jgi:hypothetical protein
VLVELTEVTGPLDTEGSKLYVNPRHVALVERGVNASAPDRQSFVSEITIAGVGKRRVNGSPAEVKRILNSQGGRT